MITHEAKDAGHPKTQTRPVAAGFALSLPILSSLPVT